MRPSCAAAMLLDALSIGHEVVMDMAERDFLQDRASGESDGYGYGGVGGGYTYKRGACHCLLGCVDGLIAWVVLAYLTPCRDMMKEEPSHCMTEHHVTLRRITWHHAHYPG